METNEIVKAIDDEISKLQQARAILAGTVVPDKMTEPAKRRGRPKGSGVKATAEAAAAFPAKTAKKTMSAEGRARIIAAQRARWAAKRKAAAQERAARWASAKPAKKAAKVAAKKPANSAVKTSSAKKAATVKKAAEPQAKVTATSV